MFAVIMVSKEKNPLSIFFGAFLQNARKIHKPDSTMEEITHDLAISTSLYKMIESGNANLNINRLFDLIKVFSEVRLEFDRLAKYFAGISFIDSQISKKIEGRKAFNYLADQDEEFREFYLRIEKHFAFPDDSKKQKEFIQNNVVAELAEFLSNKQYLKGSGEKFEGVLIQKIKSVPSLSVEILLNFIESFGKIIPQHFGHIASEWEIENSKNFVCVQGFYLSPGYIVDEKNLDRYHYSFLEHSHFNEVRFLFVVNDGESAKSLKSKFIRLLNEGREKKNMPILDKTLEAKIHIKTIDLPNEVMKKLVLNPNKISEGLHAFWVFNTINGNRIAFTGVSKTGEVNLIYNLSYSAALERTQSFETIWDSITS